MPSIEQQFADSDRGLIITPAGCGKTELIARAVGESRGGVQLVLTHTHAGVHALRTRLHKLRIPPSRYAIHTIDGFALKYAAAFPALCGLDVHEPVGEQWNAVRDAGERVFQTRIAKRVLTLSYAGMYVDEYQDCTRQQHRALMHIAALMPCRIVGDPLQGIFDFTGDVIDWAADVAPSFHRIPCPHEPWRWIATNPQLGEWLLKVRQHLLNGDSLNFRARIPGLSWHAKSPEQQRNTCFQIQRNKGNIVALHRHRQQAHKLASQLRGCYASMDEVEGKDLCQWATNIETHHGAERALAVLRFACECHAKLGCQLVTIGKKLEEKDFDFGRLRKHKDVAQQLRDVAATDELNAVVPALDRSGSIDGIYLYRYELWRDMRAALKGVIDGSHETLAESAWHVRDRYRLIGRSVSPRTVSRPLLIKGLEFDHCIILDADSLSAKELYVAMTRGSYSLTVLCGQPVLQKPAPKIPSSFV